MASGTDMVKLAEPHIGEKYILGASVPKNDKKWSGPWDCAEFCSWLVFQASGQLYGCEPTAKKPERADAWTGYWRDDAKARGQIVAVEVARRTPGAFLLRVPKPSGHIAISDGNGGTIEAMGAAFGVRRGAVSGRAWDFGILVPGFDYGGKAVPDPSEPAPEPPAPSERVLILRRQSRPVENLQVEMLQKALQDAGFDPGPADGLFGPLTEAAVFEFQEQNNLFVDGEVGPITGRALGLPFWKAKDKVPIGERPAEPQDVPKPAADWPEDTRSVIPSVKFDDIRNEYLRLWDTVEIHPKKQPQVRKAVATALDGKARYEAVAAKFPGLPWAVVAIIHALECSSNFRKHLHNGDSLSARTVRVPKARPAVWDPAWPWETSAEDAIRVDGFDRVESWTLPRTLFQFERYNGFGPRRRFGQATAYLWSFSNHYVRGKYVGDSIWDPDAVSAQVGAALILKELIANGSADALRRSER